MVFYYPFVTPVMNRLFPSVALIVVLIGWFFWSVEEDIDGEPKPVGLLGEFSVGENDEDEPTLGEDVLPPIEIDRRLGFEAYSLLDQTVEVESEVEVVRRTLIRSKDDSNKTVLIEETYRKENQSLAWTMDTWVAMVGDELIFENDRDRVDSKQLAEFFEQEGLRIGRQSRLSNFVQIEIENPRLARFDRIRYRLGQLFPEVLVDSDILHFTSSKPNDYNSALLWNLDQIKIEDAWAVSTGGENVVIGIVDTGVDHSHVDLVRNIWVNENEIPGNRKDDDGNGFIDDVNGWDFVNDDNDPQDDAGHGTHIAGIVGASGNNGKGVVGLNWDVSIMALKAGDGESLSSSNIAEALRYMRMMKERGVAVVVSNNSYGSDGPSNVIHSEIAKQEADGILFVVAAGNDGEDIDRAGAEFPAGFEDDIIVAVASSNQIDTLNVSSNYGRTSVDLAAPGNDVYSTLEGERYGYRSGTSMACPHVAGAIALMMSSDSSLAWRDVKNRLLDTVDRVSSLDGRVLSGGRLNLAAALRPSLLEFSLEEVRHDGELIFLSDIRVPVFFELQGAEGAIISEEVVSGVGVVSIERLGRVYEFRFPEEGRYEIEFSAELDEVLRIVKRTVFVGPIESVGDGLFHYWNFDGDTEGEPDLAGGSNGTLLNVSRQSSVLGSSGRFTGSNSYMSFESTHTPLITVSAMVRLDQLGDNPHPRILNMDDYYLYISARESELDPDGNSDVLKFYSDRSESFGIWNTEPGSIVSGRWIHVAATYDSSSENNNPILYIDGEKRLARVQAPAIGNQLIFDGTAYVGDNEDGLRGFDGLIDEVRVYDRVLSDGEVSTLAATHYGRQWEDVSIRREASVEFDSSYVFSLMSDGVDFFSGSVEWSVLGADHYEVLTVDRNTASFEFFEGSDLLIVAKASDGVVTEYFTKEFVLKEREIVTGNWIGEDTSGALIVVHLDESLDSGYVSLFDRNGQTLLLREAINVLGNGAFETGEGSAYLVKGIIDGDVVVSVSGVGIAFLELKRIEGVAFGQLVGDYRGGVVGSSGDRFDVQVFGDGRVLIVRSGLVEDMAWGEIDSDGVFSIKSVGGVLFDGRVVENRRFVEGVLGLESERRKFFCRRDGEASASRFVNLSTRGRVADGEAVLIGGFVIEGNERQNVLIRGVGPGLARTFGLLDVLEDPLLQVLDESGDVIDVVDWAGDGASEELSQLFERVGAFGLSEGSSDAAVALSLESGAYTAIIRGENGKTGEALFEVYDASTGMDSAFVNVSTRGRVAGNSIVLIGGFVVKGTEPINVLLRAAGPSLSSLDVENPLSNPRLDLFKEDLYIAGNDNWMDSGTSRLEESFVGAGAFSFDRGSKDAALDVWLSPGVYSIVVSGVDGSEGISLVEAYELR